MSRSSKISRRLVYEILNTRTVQRTSVPTPRTFKTPKTNESFPRFIGNLSRIPIESFELWVTLEAIRIRRRVHRFADFAEGRTRLDWIEAGKTQERQEKKEERTTNLSRRGGWVCSLYIWQRGEIRDTIFSKFYLATRPVAFGDVRIDARILSAFSCHRCTYMYARRLSVPFESRGRFPRCNCDICAPQWDFIREQRAQALAK